MNHMLPRRTLFAAIALLATGRQTDTNAPFWQYFQHYANFAALGGLVDIPVEQAASELRIRLNTTTDASATEILAALHRNVITDFEAERIVSVRGWQISRTEALMAVLAHHGQDLV